VVGPNRDRPAAGATSSMTYRKKASQNVWGHMCFIAGDAWPHHKGPHPKAGAGAMKTYRWQGRLQSSD